MSGSSDQQTSTVQNPPWLDQASQDLLSQAGQVVSGAQTNPQQQAAYDTAGYWGSMANPALGIAGNTMADNAGYQANYDWLGPLASMLGGGGFNFGGGMAGGGGGGGMGAHAPASTADISTIDLSQLHNIDPRSTLDYNIGDYMDPYTQQVIDAQSGDIERARQLAGNNDAASAAGAGAFGGSRAGVVDALTNAEYDRNDQTMSAQLRDAAYNNARGLIAGDITNATNADTFNATNYNSGLLANAGFENAGAQFNAGQINNILGADIGADAQTTAAGLSAAASRYGAAMGAHSSELSALINGALGYGQLGLGADLNAATLRGNSATQLQGFGSGGMNANLGAGDAQYSQPFDDVGWLGQIIGNVPHGQSASQPIYHNRGAGAVGGAATGASAGSAFGPWGTAIGAIGGGLMGYYGG